jgi:hypothetical protein
VHLPIGHALVIPICFWDAKRVRGEAGLKPATALILMGDWRGVFSPTPKPHETPELRTSDASKAIDRSG